ncbi:peptidyl-prolyl cis-trans isomerase [Candidatus Falkowbacteria bacterium]|nr:peptidyl-prolyl cis-trans isomerase [Candidatus Falkowbacteria bacterium]
MSVEQFKAKVVRDNLLVNKLSESIGFDDALQADVKKKADEVLAAVSAGDKSFEDLAKQYSEDTTTAAQGGDLGWFGRGVMVAEFEQAAFALSPGETSQLVKTIFGYHIIKVLEKKEPSADGAQPEEVRAEHILIKGFDLNSYLAKAKDGNQVKKYVKFAGTE